MSHFLKDRPHLWHGNLMKLILTVGLLSILAVSEIKAQTFHSITTEFAMSASTEAGTTTPAQVKNTCKRTWIATLKPKCQACIMSCHPETVAEDCIGSCSAICGELEFSPEMVFCCDGFWGDSCDQECPGGSGNPCSGHGKCSSQHGQCVCEPGFGGTACELCTNVTKYWPNCSLGENPCQSPVSPCGKNSQCIHTGAGRHRCACHDGYAGDGTECAPINPCQNNSGGCDVTTDCIYTGPNQHKCQCKDGYEGDNPDEGCTIKDMCSPGICGRNAVCETREPLKHSCVCNEGYTWEGTLCQANIIKKLEELNTQDTRFKDKLQHMVNITTRFYSEVLTRPGPFTMFVPTDQAFRNVMKDTQLANLLGDDNKLQQILRQHIAAGQFMNTSSSSFYNLQGNLVNLETKTSLTSGNITYYVLSCDNSTSKDRSHVVEGNLKAWNGIIHVINDVVGMTDLMSGGTQETAMDLIKTQADYSTMHSMIMAAGLSELFSRPNTTVLITNNKAWDSPSLIEQYYLKNEEEGRRKLEVILKNHVFPGVIDVTDLISNRNRKSYANIDVKVHLSNKGQIRLDGDVSITKANMPVKTGLCHRVDKVLVPSYLIPLVNNVCTVEETQKVEGHCVKCYESWKNSCPLSTDTPTDENINCGGWHPHPWDLSWRDRQLPFPMPGRGRRLCGFFSCFPPYDFEEPHCYRMCLRTAKRRTCCKGFYGNICLPCPGGSSNPCSGNGKCSDGDRGTGVCSCNDKFTGATCNRCVDDKTFGPQCNESCTCKFGQCDSGPRGTGKCRSGTCQLGYSGENCDTEMIPCESDDLCHVNAKCYLGEDGIESCHCLPGYEDDGDRCSMIDLCAEERNPCDQQATCSQEWPGATKCTCNIGWHGDGFGCMPNKPCDNRPCHPSAVCQDIDLAKYLCVCKTGYSGNGLVCKLANLCLERNGNCHPEAKCTFIKEGERNCACPEYMIGDGVTCRLRTIAEHVMVNDDLAHLRQLMQILKDSNNALDVVNGSYTFLAPDKQSFAKALAENPNSAKYLSQEKHAVAFLKFHTLDGALSSEDILAHGFTGKTYQTLHDGATIHVKSEVLKDEGLDGYTALRRRRGADGLRQQLAMYHSGAVHRRDVTETSLPQSLHDTSRLSFDICLIRSIRAINGYVQIIDQVLGLPVPSLTDVLCSKPQYQLFYEALQKTNVLETLISLDEYTLFVLPNDVVRGVDGNITADFLKYYILPQRVDTSSMADGLTIDTLLGSKHRLLMKAYPRALVNDIMITDPDMWTDVGVVHELEEVLHPVLTRQDVNDSETYLCSDGERGTGECLCNKNFVGTTCNRCADDNTFGPHCNEPCTCQFGQCDSGPEGTGKCRSGTCQLGYSGGNCDKEMVPCESDDLCPVNAKCYLGEDGIESCHCPPGYEETGDKCSMIDLCAEGSNPCHQQATCSQEGPGASKCTCNIGWHGDGYSCMPNQPCDSHPDCHPSAVCQDLEPGQYRCVCKTGYSGNGLVCTLVDLCLELNGNCHPEAQCTFIKDGERNCTCPEFMVGDGITCRQRTIAEEIMENPKLARLRRILKIVNASNNILDVVNTSYTFFAPNGRSFVNKFKKHTTSLEYWSQEENALSFLKFHTIKHAFSTDDLMASDGVIQSFPTLYDGYSLHIENIKQNLHIYSSHSRPAVIRRANMSAVNGYIHIINQVLVPFIPDSQEPSFTTLLSSKPKYKLFYEALQETNVLETLSSLKEYTLFVFPNGVIQHMKRKITADFLKYHILPQRVSTNAMLDKTEKDTILGSRHRLSVKRSRRKIYINDVKITRPDMWTDVGVIHEIPEFLRPVHNRCDLTISEAAVKTECCAGYYGPDCDGCPGGPEDPCSGNGVCDDGVRGSGKCKCNPGFSGELCETF